MTANECMKSPEPCWYHRYHCVHTKPGSEKVYDHSQGTWDDDLRGVKGVETFPSSLYEHGMTASQLRTAANELRLQSLIEHVRVTVNDGDLVGCAKALAKVGQVLFTNDANAGRFQGAIDYNRNRDAFKAGYLIGVAAVLTRMMSGQLTLQPISRSKGRRD